MEEMTGLDGETGLDHHTDMAMVTIEEIKRGVTTNVGMMTKHATDMMMVGIDGRMKS
jgi:hypothetical protein